MLTMNTYLLLLRGINVGGKNTVSMASLKKYLEASDFSNVKTYINSGNVIIDSDRSAQEVKEAVEKLLLKNFTLDSELIKVLVLTPKQLQTMVDEKPKGFGDDPEKYYSDAIFLIDLDVKEAMKVFDPREGVDNIWPGKGVIYSQRLGAERTKSKLGKIISTVAYKSMTIRSWNTVMKLLKIIEDRKR